METANGGQDGSVMSDSNWEAPTPGTAADTAKPHWSKRKAGPLPVWGWIASGMVLVGIIGAFTDESGDQETSTPITVETEVDPVETEVDPVETDTEDDDESWFGDLQEDWEALKDFFGDLGVSGTDEMAVEDLELLEDFYDSLSDKTSETADRVLKAIESLRDNDVAAADDDADEPEIADVVDDEVEDEGDSEEDTTSTGDFDGPGIGDIITPQEYLSFLTVEDEVFRDGYDRDEWRHWHTKSWSGCTTREEVLVRTMVGEARSTSGDPCKATAAWWYSDYDGVWTSNSSDFDIDHIVALSEAHDSGAADWEADQKERFANDLTNLVAVSASSNRSKGDRDAADWRPSRDYWCSYAYAVVEVKANWGLSVDPAEYDALEEMIDTCSPIMSESYNWWALGTTNNVEYTDRDLTPPTTTTVPATPTTAPAATTTAPATTVPATTAPPTTEAAPETTAAPSPPANPGDSKNCPDFSSYAEAKAWFDMYFPYYGDVAGLDRDEDGEPCETLAGGPGA